MQRRKRGKELILLRKKFNSPSSLFLCSSALEFFFSSVQSVKSVFVFFRAAYRRGGASSRTRWPGIENRAGTLPKSSPSTWSATGWQERTSTWRTCR